MTEPIKGLRWWQDIVDAQTHRIKKQDAEIKQWRENYDRLNKQRWEQIQRLDQQMQDIADRDAEIERLRDKVKQLQSEVDRLNETGYGI